MRKVFKNYNCFLRYGPKILKLYLFLALWEPLKCIELFQSSPKQFEFLKSHHGQLRNHQNFTTTWLSRLPLARACGNILLAIAGCHLLEQVATCYFATWMSRLLLATWMSMLLLVTWLSRLMLPNSCYLLLANCILLLSTCILLLATC